MLTLTQTRNDIEPSLARWAVAMRRTGGQAVAEGMRRITRQVIAITPPASAGTTGREAYQQGRGAISRNLQAALIPVRLKRKRREQHPDVAAAYRARRVFSERRAGVRVGRVAKAYVDIVKYRALLRDKSARIGRMASGWLAAAEGLAVAVPAWIKRHGAVRGRFQRIEHGTRFGLVATNFAPNVPPHIRGEMARRIPYAVRYVERGLRANIHHAGLRAARQSGIKVRTGGFVAAYAA
jgi:hypothetical protein